MNAVWIFVVCIFIIWFCLLVTGNYPRRRTWVVLFLHPLEPWATSKLVSSLTWEEISWFSTFRVILLWLAILLPDKNLAGCSFSGEIPQEIGQLTQYFCDELYIYIQRFTPLLVDLSYLRFAISELLINHKHNLPYQYTVIGLFFYHIGNMWDMGCLVLDSWLFPRYFLCGDTTIHILNYWHIKFMISIFATCTNIRKIKCIFSVSLELDESIITK
jgi:hypothetical protein